RVSNCNRAIFILFIYHLKIKTQIKKSEHKSGFFFKLFILTAYLIEAAKYSRFMRAMFSKEIPLGHSTSEAPVLVQLPNPSLSIASTMFNTRSVDSTRPCSNKANRETLDETNNMADKFLKDITKV